MSKIVLTTLMSQNDKAAKLQNCNLCLGNTINREYFYEKFMCLFGKRGISMVKEKYYIVENKYNGYANC